MSIDHLFKTIETAQRSVEILQKRQALKEMMQPFKAQQMARSALYRQMHHVSRLDNVLHRERSLASYVKAADVCQRQEAWRNAATLKGLGQVRRAGQIVSQIMLPKAATPLLPTNSTLYQMLHSMTQSAVHLVGPLTQLSQNLILPFAQALSQAFQGSGLLLPLSYIATSEAITERLDRFQAFFKDIDTIKQALEERRPKQAIDLIKKLLNVWARTAHKLSYSFLRIDPAEQPAQASIIRQEAKQELLYSFISCYREVSEMSYPELMALGDPYDWMRKKMVRVMYSSIQARGYHPGTKYEYDDLDILYLDVEKLKDRNFDAFEARECLKWMCDGVEEKLLRLRSETAQEQLIIVEGIRSGRYLSEDEIKERHLYKDWRAVRTKMGGLILEL